VQDAVIADLERLTEQLGAIDVVFFTGDLVQRGDPAEFARFESTRERILETLTVDDRPPVFLTVPGNHDLARPENAEVEGLAELLVASPRLRDEFWANPESNLRGAVDKAFAAWSDWAGGLPPDDRVEWSDGSMLPGDFVATVTLGDRRLGVVGLNTTFLQLAAGDKQGKLSIDVRQVQTCWPGGSVKSWAEQHDATVLLTHHPPEWLDKEGQRSLRSLIAPPGRFTVHLFGHQHEERNLVTMVPGDEPRCELLGRSLFGMESFGEGDEADTRLHGFTAAELELRPTGPQLRLWPRAGTEREGGGWDIVPHQPVGLEQDGGTRPTTVVGGWRAPAASQVNGAAAPGREGAAEILAAALAGAQHEFDRMSVWWSKDLSPFPRKADAIERKLRGIRTPAEKLLRAIADHVSDNEPQPGWAKYAELRTQHLPRISNELLAIIGGLYLEERGRDRLHADSAQSFSSVAKRLVDLLAEQAGNTYTAEILIVGEERQEPVSAEILRLRFPACDLWNLPLAAHEYGYLVAQHRAPESLWGLKADVERGVDPELVPNDPPDLACYLPSVRRSRAKYWGRDRDPGATALETVPEPSVEELQRLQVAQVCRLFADAFAAYSVGPAYVRALLLLRMRPDETLIEPRGTMPPFTQRFVFALETLKWVREQESRFPTAPLTTDGSKALVDACDDLQQIWRNILGDAGVRDPYDDVKAKFADVGGRDGWLSKVMTALEDPGLNKDPVPVLYRRWQAACDLEGVLAGDDPARDAKPDPWASINAAWSVRARGAEDLAAVEKRAIDLLDDRLPTTVEPTETRLRRDRQPRPVKQAKPRPRDEDARPKASRFAEPAA
jgi:Calcineurin-like phosphoesterase